MNHRLLDHYSNATGYKYRIQHALSLIFLKQHFCIFLSSDQKKIIYPGSHISGDYQAMAIHTLFEEVLSNTQQYGESPT